MTRFTKTLVAILGATVLMGAMVGTASAGRLSSSENRLRATFREVVLSGILSITCSLTLEGSLHSRTFTKTVGLLLGYINRGAVGGCRGGSARINTESFPWHERYASFSGTLPAISQINTTNSGSVFEAEAFGLRCKFSGGSASGAYRVEPSGNITGVRLTATGYTSPCGSGSLSTTGEGSLENGAGGRVSLRLI